MWLKAKVAQSWYFWICHYSSILSSMVCCCIWQTYKVCFDNMSLLTCFYPKVQGWSEEVPGEPAEPLRSHPSVAHQQRFRLHSTHGLFCTAHWRHLSNSTQHPRQPAEVPPPELWALCVQHRLSVLQPGLCLLRPPDGAARSRWHSDAIMLAWRPGDG